MSDYGSLTSLRESFTHFATKEGMKEIFYLATHSTHLI